MPMMRALILDCDGVIADTERDGHRVAFNQTFREKGVAIEWGVEPYGELLRIAGGKERLRFYFNEHGWPAHVTNKEEFVKDLHQHKTNLYMQIIESGRLPVRSGIKRLVDEAAADGIKLVVCSTSNERAVNLIVGRLLGAERKARFNAILAGDVVSRKKPDPEIYDLAKERLGVPGEECVVIEDSRNGLLAAKAAGMHCVITTNGYTEREDFTEADGVFPELGDPPSVRVTLQDLKRIVAAARMR